MPVAGNTRKRQRQRGLGRSAPRSRSGCLTCRQRHVRCDEHRPICGHCKRLGLKCSFPPTAINGGWPSTSSSGQSPEALTSVGAGLEWLESEGRRSQSLELTSIEDQIHASPGPVIEHSTGSELLVSVNQPFKNSAVLHEHQCRPNPTDNSIFDWHDHGSLTDYLPMPDGTSFAFPTFAFAELVDFEELNGDGGIPVVLGVDQTPLPSNTFVSSVGWSASHTAAAPGVFTSEPNPERHSVDFLESTSNNGDSRLGHVLLGVSTTLLSAAEQHALYSLFETNIQPPASLVSVDPWGWSSTKRYLLHMARDGEDSVTNALFALSEHLRWSNPILKPRFGRANTDLLAARLHEASRVAVDVEVRRKGWETERSNALLASIFLLAWFEVVSDGSLENSPQFPTALAEVVICRGRRWSSGSKRLLQCLDSLDVKTSHLSDRHLLSEAALDVVLKHRSSLSLVEGINETENDVHISTEPNAQGGASQKRLLWLLSCSAAPMPPPKVIKMDIFNTLLQPALDFHLTSQTYSRRISAQDTHNRGRDTVEDEYEVISVCRKLEEELQDLWNRRPGLLNLSAAQLRHFINEDIAKCLEQLFSVYIASFWSHFIHMHRIAWRAFRHTPIVVKAIEEAGKMMRRSVGQPIDQYAFDTSIVHTPASVIHPGLMWTAWLFGAEVTDPVQREWAILQLKALGESRLAGQNGSDTTTTLEWHGVSLHLDERGAQNALRVSALLKALVERQERLEARVDGRVLCRELFGCNFYII